MNVKIHMTKQGYRHKPRKQEIALISKDITESAATVEIEELAREVGENGKAFTPAFFSGSRRIENFISQQIFALDFDGGMTVDEFKERAASCQVFPAFLYATYNYAEENHRFRAVFVNDCEVNDARAASIIIGLLLEIFPEADRQCKDVSRLFFGGKGLLYINIDTKMDLFNLAVSVQTYAKIKDPKNYARKMKKIADDHGIGWDGKTLQIYRIEKNSQNEEFVIDTDNTIIVNVSDSSNYVIFQNIPLHQDSQRHKRAINCLRNKTLKEIMDICPLFRDFYTSAEDIPHEYKFLLATNLVHVDGGRELFFHGLKEGIEKWKIQWQYIVERSYYPMKCPKGNCPYAEICRCDTLLEKLEKKIHRIAPPEQYITLEEAWRQLTEFLEQCYRKRGTGIHLITAQTAMGKTTAYCDLVEKYNHTQNKKILIAVPTTKLQGEVAEQLKKRGVDVLLTPSIKRILEWPVFGELRREIQRLYDTGYGYKVKGKIRTFIKGHKEELTDTEIWALDFYLNCKEKLDGTTCVVTTHKYFLALPEKILQQYEIIIDEDILMSIFKNTESISLKDLRYALSKGGVPARIRSRVEEIARMHDGSVGFTGIGKVNHGESDEIYEKELDLCSSLLGFLESSVYHIDSAGEKIDYFTAQPLPKVKMIIVSATLKLELYQDYCCDIPVFYYEAGKVKYKGKLLQYTAYPVTRHYLEQVSYETMEKKAKAIAGNEEIDIITFKKYSAGKDIYFGKTEGFNQYQGKDIAVIGTPYSVPFIYQLIGTYLGYDKNDHMCRRKVVYNGYSFPLMAYGNQKMQELLFYFLQSDLEQAIGRARLLRYDCTVYLFSNFPCNQAEIIQKDYLESNS